MVVVSGLLIGLIYKMTTTEDKSEYYEQRKERIFHALDSLAEAEKTTYIGTDMQGNTVEELKKGDTVVEKTNYFGGKPPKELPKEKININTASRVGLMKLPGVGEATADRIIAYREINPFAKPTDLLKVKGIGPKKFEKLKDYIEVSQ